MLMPFRDEFDDTYVLGIKAACEAAGTYCERVDEQFYQGRILDRIYNQIAKADIIVSDMSGRNPNVFYETGYAHALGKQVILLTQDAVDIPFDLKDYPLVIYGKSILTLKNELEKRVRWCVDNPSGSLASVDFGLVLYINRMPYQRDTVLDLVWHYDSGSPLWECVFAVSFHNAIERAQAVFCRVKLEIPPEMGLSEGLPTWTSMSDISDIKHAKGCVMEAVLPNDNLLFGLGNIDVKTLPDEWVQLPPRVLRSYSDQVPGHPSMAQNVLTLHIYTELGPKEFSVEFKPPKTLRTEDVTPSS